MKKIRIKKNNQYGFLYIRRTEVDTRAHIEFNSGDSETILYDKFDSEDYILEDLGFFHGYTAILSEDEEGAA